LKPSTLSLPTIPIFSVPPSLSAFISHTTTPKQREIPSLIQPTLPATKSSMIPLVSQKAKTQVVSPSASPIQEHPPLRSEIPILCRSQLSEPMTGQEGNASFTSTGVSSADHVFFAPPPSRHTSSKLPTIPGSLQYQPTEPTPHIEEELTPFRSRRYSMISTTLLPMSSPRQKICIIRPRTFM
jgi:hypothetical protein